MKKNYSAIFSLLFVIPHLYAQSATFRAANISDQRFSIYLDIRYKPAKTLGENLTVVGANAVVLSNETGEGGKRTRRTDLSCKQSDELMNAVQNHRGGHGLEGIMLAMKCTPEIENANLLGMVMVAAEVRKKGGSFPQSCDSESALSTPAVAMIALGHSEICFEDWSRVPDPINRFIAEYEKRYGK